VTPPGPGPGSEADADLRAALVAAFRWAGPGISDPSGWWREPAVLARLGPALAALHADALPTVVLAPASSGFLLGPLVAAALGAGFVGAHRGGRPLAGEVRSRRGAADHRGRAETWSVPARHLGPADRVLLVDDWVDSGAQLTALAALAADCGAGYVGAAAVVDAAGVVARRELRLRALLRFRDLAPDGQP
jgi:adenine phosphoribosyltransferase